MKFYGSCIWYVEKEVKVKDNWAKTIVTKSMTLENLLWTSTIKYELYEQTWLNSWECLKQHWGNLRTWEKRKGNDW